MHRWLLLSALLLAAPTGCGATAYNVRAYKAYAMEEPSLPVVLDRVDDLAACLDLIEVMLFETPYRPGDTWPDRVVLQDGRASSIRADVRMAYPYQGTDAEVPLVKLWRIHLERELSTVSARPDNDPSLMGALVARGGPVSGLRTEWLAFSSIRLQLRQARSEQQTWDAQLATPGRAAQPGDPARTRAEAEKVTRLQTALESLRSGLWSAALAAARSHPSPRDALLLDATSVVSVAYRIDLELHALMPVVAAQALGSLRTAPHDLAHHPSLQGIRQVDELPSFLTTIGSKLTAQLDSTKQLASALASANDMSVDETPGFDLHESLVDQIVGVTRDSFHVDTRAGAEAFFFHQDVADAKADDEASSDTSSDTKVTKDFTGRTTRLQYRIKPIVLVAGRLDAGFDAPHFPNAANLSLAYHTDRVFSANGSLDTSTSLSRQIGVRGVASDVIDFGAGIFGVHTSARVARFTAGEVRTVGVDPATGRDTGYTSDPVPLQLSFKQLDIGYDTTRFLGVGASLMGLEQLLVGFRYYSYGLPRILYELEDVNADPKVQDYRFVRESPAQPVLSRLYMGGVSARFGGSPRYALSPFAGVSAYLGGGPIAYYFLTDPSLPDGPSNRDSHRRAAFGLTAGLAVGVRYRLVSADSPLRIFAEAQYQGDMVYASVTESQAAVRQADPSTPGVEVGTNRIVEFGGVDLFHGPRVTFVGSF